jgi:phosphoribosylglycinamide formyltransferase-1/phosphoribosylamine--glycine ligase/phosphoribosylglycinamide formyltransferase/phosphoribosylformylglycinamidine cyclo-ligase
MLSPDPDRVLERLRALCLTLPETGERISHGAPAFDVAGKMFAYFRHNHHGDGTTAVCVKTSGRDEQNLLLELDPDLYSLPAYLGPSGWIAIDLAPEETDWAHIGERLRTSYRLAAPRRLQNGIEAGG